MIRMNWKMCLALALGTCLVVGAAQAGETQIGVRVGKSWLKVDAERMATGQPVDESLGTFGFTVGHRWEQGGYIEAGYTTATNLDIFSFDTLEHLWLGAGWQFNLSEKWKLTPKAGLTYSSLEADDEELFDDFPTRRLHDVVPYAEINLERQLGRHYRMGLYFRENFEEWGSSRGWGLTMAWHW